MDSTVIMLVTATLFGWGLVSKRLARADLTAPIVFIVVGAVLAWVGLVDGPEESAALTPLVEVTLVWVLFSDAARLPLRELRHDVGRYVRLLGVGLPLTVLLGWALSAWFWPGLGLWLALFVGAALAPTDAALGVPVVTNPVVPSRIRQLITVESGLNDGIVTPVVMVAIAGAAAAAGLEGHEGAGHAVVQLALGVLIGSAVGAAGWLAAPPGPPHATWPPRTSPASPCSPSPCSRMPPHSSWTATGSSPRSAAGWPSAPAPADAHHRSSSSSSRWASSSRRWCGWPSEPSQSRSCSSASTRAWCCTPSSASPWCACCRSPWPWSAAGLSRRTVLFVGWFGPRGLASLVFALLALEALGPVADEAVAIVTVTVLLSVLAHGLSAAPLAARYGAAEAAAGPEPGGPVDVVDATPGSGGSPWLTSVRGRPCRSPGSGPGPSSGSPPP